MVDDAKYNLAIEEWKLSQSVIAQLEDSIYRRQGWLFALITALLFALLGNDAMLTKSQFAFLAVGILVVFYIAEIIQRVPHHRAIQRSRQIEKYLRGEDTYEGPSLSQWLGQGNGLWDFFAFWHRVRIWAPYAAVTLVVLIALCFVR